MTSATFSNSRRCRPGGFLEALDATPSLALQRIGDVEAEFLGHVAAFGSAGNATASSRAPSSARRRCRQRRWRAPTGLAAVGSMMRLRPYHAAHRACRHAEVIRTQHGSQVSTLRRGAGLVDRNDAVFLPIPMPAPCLRPASFALRPPPPRPRCRPASPGPRATPVLWHRSCGRACKGSG
jgi:hypothetical protein